MSAKTWFMGKVNSRSFNVDYVMCELQAQLLAYFCFLFFFFSFSFLVFKVVLEFELGPHAY
jgi:hypothetical protein